DAVSPVIGVILMVAIVVILAAIIAAFVFGMVGTVEGTKVVGVTASIANVGSEGGDNPEISVTWQGGADLNNIVAVRPTLGGEYPTLKGDDGSSENGWISDSHNEPFLTAGDVWLLEWEDGPDSTTNERFVITARFRDGTDQVIFDRSF
ncbi:type IV pilin N-terminal domain-containing protein, partial [Methanocalculus sp. MSAO_Arc2]|uniref:type IV pilin N-terminal domain-containing protein n=1 Tax=Methanocalculus sp. MSAO_Arc2 TaxID=2293855 RepID=UPI003217E953